MNHAEKLQFTKQYPEISKSISSAGSGAMQNDVTGLFPVTVDA